jgi:hypothetical protein
VLDAVEPLFLNRRDHLTVADEDGGAVMHGEPDAVVFVLTLAPAMHA